MPTPTSNLDYKLEQAVINWLGATGTHSITIGVSSIVHDDATDSAALPRITVKADVESEHLHNSGHYRCRVTVRLLTQADDTSLTTADGYWRNVRAILNWDELRERLSDLTDFHCWLVIRDGGEITTTSERHHDRAYSFTAICQAADNS